MGFEHAPSTPAVQLIATELGYGIPITRSVGLVDSVTATVGWKLATGGKRTRSTGTTAQLRYHWTTGAAAHDLQRGLIDGVTATVL